MLNPRQDPNLTVREREVVRLIAEGLSNKQIAHRMGIAVSTTKAHCHQAMLKMGLRNRTQVATHAAEVSDP